MRSAAPQKYKQVGREPCQHEERAENDHDGECTPRMAEFLLAILDARGFGLIAFIRHALEPENGQILNHWKRRPQA